MGMPEYVAPISPPSGGSAPAALLLRAEQARVEPETLGYQFVLGFLPLTRLYLEHGINASVEEATLAVLQEQGYAPFIVGKKSFARAVSVIRPRLILSTNVSDVSLHAYDLIFLRVLSLDGTLTVSRISSNGILANSYSLPIKEKRYRKHAHAPAMASILEANLRNGMRELLADKRVGRQSRRPAVVPTKTTTPLVLLESPSSRFPMPLEIGKQIAESYGFREVPAFSQAAVLRMVQRGLATGLDESFIALSPPNPEQIFRTGEPYWVLATALERLVLHSSRSGEGPGLELTLRLDIRERGAQLLGASCRTYQPLLAERDGYWVVTIEQAASDIVAAFMNLSSKSSDSSSTSHVSCAG